MLCQKAVSRKNPGKKEKNPKDGKGPFEVAGVFRGKILIFIDRLSFGD
jgi:hypothetical protein